MSYKLCSLEMLSRASSKAGVDFDTAAARRIVDPAL